jgi:hypothetical protein
MAVVMVVMKELLMVDLMGFEKVVRTVVLLVWEKVDWMVAKLVDCWAFLLV